MPDTKIREALARQYRAALDMLGQAISACPESLWLDASYPNRTWHIAYHVLFCAHVYLQTSHEAFRPWEKARENYHFLGAMPMPPHERPVIDTPYSKEELLEFTQICRDEVDAKMPTVDFAAPSGFFWIELDKFELQLYNLRHIQHHTAQLADRLRTACGVGVPWTGAKA